MIWLKSTGQILLMIQNYQRFCWLPGCSPPILAKCSYFWGDTFFCRHYFFFFFFLLPWYSDTLQLNDSTWHVEIEVHKAVGFHVDFTGLFLTCKYINCLGHKQWGKTHIFLYCAAEAMLNGRDTWEKPLLDCLDFSARYSGKSFR